MQRVTGRVMNSVVDQDGTKDRFDSQSRNRHQSVNTPGSQYALSLGLR